MAAGTGNVLLAPDQPALDQAPAGAHELTAGPGGEVAAANSDALVIAGGQEALGTDLEWIARGWEERPEAPPAVAAYPDRSSRAVEVREEGREAEPYTEDWRDNPWQLEDDSLEGLIRQRPTKTFEGPRGDEGHGVRSHRHRRTWSEMLKREPKRPAPPKPPRAQKSPKPPKVTTRADVEKAAERVAKAVAKAEGGGFGWKMWNLARANKAYDKKLRAAADGEALTTAEKTQMAMEADEYLWQQRVAQSEAKVGRVRKFLSEYATFNFISKRLAPIIKEHPKKLAAIAAVLVLAGTVIGGGLLPAGVLMAAAASGAVVGGTRKYQIARLETAEDNVTSEVEGRVNTLDAARRAAGDKYQERGATDQTFDSFDEYIRFSQAQRYTEVGNYRRGKRKNERNAALGGAAIGMVAAPLAAMGVVGARFLGEGIGQVLSSAGETIGDRIDFAEIVDDLNPMNDAPEFIDPVANNTTIDPNAITAPPPPVDVMPQLQDALQGDPAQLQDQLSKVPGFEGVKVNIVTEQLAEQHYEGRYVLDSLKDGLGTSGDETMKVALDEWSGLHDNPSVKIHTWGDIHFEDGRYEPTGERWGVDVTANNLKILDSNGDIQVFNGKLGEAQHANLLDLLHQEGTQILDPSNASQMEGLVAEHPSLANVSPAEMPQTGPELKLVMDVRADNITDGVISRMEGLPIGDNAETQAALQAAIAEDASSSPLYAQLSDPRLLSYLASEVERELLTVWGSAETGLPAWAGINLYLGAADALKDADFRSRKRKKVGSRG